MFENHPEIKEYINSLCVQFLTEEVADAIEAAIDAGEFEREIQFLGKPYQAKELIRLNKHYKNMITSVVEMSVRSTIVSTQLGTAGMLSTLIGPPPQEVLDKLSPEMQEMLKEATANGPSILEKILGQNPAGQPNKEVKDVKDDWFTSEQDKARRRSIKPENN